MPALFGAPEGQWVDVPGKGRRWQQPSGELMEVAPGWSFVAEQLRRATQGISTTPSANAGYQPGGGRMRGRKRAAAAPDLNAGMTGSSWPAGVPQPGTPVDPSTWSTGPAPVLSDDRDARASEATRMLQQATPFWEREENKNLLQAAQVGGGPRAGEAGYAQRADIAAWIEANKNAPKGVDGKNIVDRFLEKQRSQGLLDAPGQTGGFGGERIAMPADAASAAQAGQRGLVGFEGSALDQAQANVSELQARERDARTQQIWQAAASGALQYPGAEVELNQAPGWNQATQVTADPGAFSGMEIAQPFTNPEYNRQYAALAQPADAQSVATRQEPADPADELARRHLTRAAMTGN
jgi:hypothetical protein